MLRQPSLFVSHGSPMFAIESGLLGPRLVQLGQELKNVKYILVVSAHWQTPNVCVTAASSQSAFHDFGGFPAPLYDLRYEPPGSPELAQTVIDLFTQAGLPAAHDNNRKLDHGVWVPLRYIRPDADIPVIQVSLPFDLSAESAIQLGQILGSLRDQGVLIIGSGGLTHNLYEFRRPVKDTHYAIEFSNWVFEALETRNNAALANYRKLAPHAERAHPSEEHFLPLLVAVGASLPDESRTLIHGGMTYGVLSMDSFGFGLSPKQQKVIL